MLANSSWQSVRQPGDLIAGSGQQLIRPGQVQQVTSYGLTASQVVRQIGLLLVFASQKIVHKVRNEMAECLLCC